VKPSGSMAVQPWMTASATRDVLAALTAKGAVVRFVGGCVRDALLQRDIRDIDLATNEPPEGVLALLKQAGIHAIPTGIAHGTVTAVLHHQLFEITTLRQDIEPDGRHAKVAYIDDWQADAARRDFTMNAVFCDPDGTLYDPFDGVADLFAGRVRFVGDPKTRIEEDVLRLLRFFRFYAEYGNAPPDEDAITACRELAPLLPRLSGERVRAELLRLLGSSACAETIRLMHGEGVLAHILPEATDAAFDALAALVALEASDAIPVATAPVATAPVATAPVAVDAAAAQPIRRLAILLPGGSEMVGEVAARLKLSNAEKRRLMMLVTSPIGVGGFEDARGVRRALYGFGPGRVTDHVLLHWARLGPAPSEAAIAPCRTALLEAAVWQEKKFPIGGKDLLALGFAAGPEIGDVLERVEGWWLDGDFTASRAACLEKAVAFLEGA